MTLVLPRSLPLVLSQFVTSSHRLNNDDDCTRLCDLQIAQLVVVNIVFASSILATTSPCVYCSSLCAFPVGRWFQSVETYLEEVDVLTC